MAIGNDDAYFRKENVTTNSNVAAIRLWYVNINEILYNLEQRRLNFDLYLA